MQQFRFRCQSNAEREERKKAAKAKWRNNNREFLKEKARKAYAIKKEMLGGNGKKGIGGQGGKGEGVQSQVQVLPQGGDQGARQEALLAFEAELCP